MTTAWVEKQDIEGQGIEALWESFYGELLAFARSRLTPETEAEDVLQVAFLRAYSQLESGTAPNNARAWLYQIVRNLVIDTHRQHARRREIPEPEGGLDHRASPVADPVADPAEPTEVGDDVHTLLAQSLPRFIEQLRSPYREAIELTEIQGLTQSEAARRVGVSLSGMKSRVQRGRKQLLKLLQECCAFGVDARNRVISCRRHPVGDDCCDDASAQQH